MATVTVISLLIGRPINYLTAELAGRMTEMLARNEARQCRTDRNVVGSVDAGVFVGYGGAFSLGASFNLDSYSLRLFATVRAGRGVGWLAGAGGGVSSSEPAEGLTSTQNLSAAYGVGGTLSRTGAQTSVSGGASYGPRVGFEVSTTDNLTETATIFGGRENC